jgi:methanogenic corrinoid protein MtbC1
MSQLDSIVFGKKKFSDILQEIYTNQNEKKKQVSALINELKPLISDIGDATLVVPLIKEYMEIGVKNDEQLIKMATIIQRAVATQSSEGEYTISDDEKEQLLQAMQDLQIDNPEK